MGSGKSTVLAALAARGYVTVPEPARIVLAEQRASGGDGVPDRSPQRFCDLMLERMRRDFTAHDDAIFDRGTPDLVGYYNLFGLKPPDTPERYDDPVFVLPSWPDIYTTDDERTMTYEMAKAFGDDVRATYERLGYTLVDVPKATPDGRADFIVGAAPPLRHDR